MIGSSGEYPKKTHIGQLNKILIVDDEMLIRQGVKHYIDWEKEGFTIVGEASNGQEALELIDKLSPDLVITDIVMPIMDGEQLTHMIKRDYPNIEVIVLSSYSDFKYVRSTFQSGVNDYILKPNLDSKELLDAVRKIKNKRPEQIVEAVDESEESIIQVAIEKALSGFEVKDQNTLLERAFPGNSFSIVGMIFTSTQNHQESIYRLKEDVDTLIASHATDIKFYKLTTNQDDMTLLVNYQKDQLEVVLEVLEKTFNDYASIIKWFLTKPFCHLNDLKKNMAEEYKKMEQYLFYLTDQPFLIYNHLPDIQEINEEFDLNQFMTIFKHREIDQALQYLLDYSEKLSRNYQRDVMELKSFLGNIIFNVIVLLGNMNYDNKALDQAKYAYFTRINESRTANEAMQYLQNFIEEVKETTGTSRNETHIQSLLAYIDKHYAEQLTLTNLADHFHFNPSYLSAYFSNHHSEGFSEYLNRVRIEKSLELLTKSKISISVISGMVGYSDHSYYCKVFKKMTGLSPSGYRRKFTSKD